MAALEARSTVQIVNTATQKASIHQQTTPFSHAEATGIVTTPVAVWTAKSLGVEVFLKPILALRFIQQFVDWEVHEQ